MFTLENPNLIPRANFNSNPKSLGASPLGIIGLELELALGIRFGFSKVNILWSLDSSNIVKNNFTTKFRLILFSREVVNCTNLVYFKKKMLILFKPIE